MRIAAGIWNLGLGIVLLSHGYQVGVLALAASAVLFCAAYFFARGKAGIRRNGRS